MMVSVEDLLWCPAHRCALTAGENGELVCTARGERYPVVDGVAVMLPDEGERARAAGGDVKGGEADALSFYNAVFEKEGYSNVLPTLDREKIAALVGRAPAGPVLELGSGRGALAGIGGRYVAFDYSLSALRRWIDAGLGRICGTAERLPLRDGSIAFLYSIDVLEHVPRPDLAMEEIDRVLMPGGLVYVRPAWHCAQYNCEGIGVRPYRDLTLRQKWVKATLGVRRNAVLKAATTLPMRLARRVGWRLREGATRLRFSRLRPDYEKFWLSDSDAVSRLDAHEGCLFFASRGYEMIEPGAGALAQLTARHVTIVARKGGGGRFSS